VSGGEVAVLPVGLVLAPALAVVAGAGIAAMLAVRAAQAGTEATGRALERLGDEMLRAADAQDDRAMRARLWEVAAGAAVQTNQDLRLLHVRAEHAGLKLALPPSLDLSECRLADIKALVAGTQNALADARRQVEQAEANRERLTLLAKLPAPADTGLTVAEVLARHQEVLARRRRVTTTAATTAALPEIDAADVKARINEILLRLDDGSTAADRERVLLAAARAEAKKDPGASRTFVETLARIVDKEINPTVARRREAANLLDALEHPAVTEVINDLAPPRPPCFSSIERLRAVVRGDADLTEDDRRDARSALARVEPELNRRRLLDGLVGAFAGLGYEVSTGLETQHSATLSVARAGWNGGHTADVWVDSEGHVQARLVQRAAEAGEEAGRCADLNASLHRVGEELNRRGIAAEVRVPSRPLPALHRHGDSNSSTTSVDDTELKYHAKEN
jgi:hypothetical protein